MGENCALIEMQGCSRGQYSKISASTNLIECFDCKYGCALCQYSQTLKVEQCIQCLDTDNWYLKAATTNLCISKMCPEGFIFNANFGCEQCPFMCKQCIRNLNSSLECKTCYFNEYYLLGLDSLGLSKCIFHPENCPAG